MNVKGSSKVDPDYSEYLNYTKSTIDPSKLLAETNELAKKGNRFAQLKLDLPEAKWYADSEEVFKDTSNCTRIVSIKEGFSSRFVDGFNKYKELLNPDEKFIYGRFLYFCGKLDFEKTNARNLILELADNCYRPAFVLAAKILIKDRQKIEEGGKFLALAEDDDGARDLREIYFADSKVSFACNKLADEFKILNYSYFNPPKPPTIPVGKKPEVLPKAPKIILPSDGKKDEIP